MLQAHLPAHDAAQSEVRTKALPGVDDPSRSTACRPTVVQSTYDVMLQPVITRLVRYYVALDWISATGARAIVLTARKDLLELTVVTRSRRCLACATRQSISRSLLPCLWSVPLPGAASRIIVFISLINDMLGFSKDFDATSSAGISNNEIDR